MKSILTTALILFISMPVFADPKAAQNNLQTQNESEPAKKETRKIASSSTQENEEELAYREEYRPETLRQAAKESSESEGENKQEKRSSMRDPLMTGREFHEHHNHY